MRDYKIVRPKTEWTLSLTSLRQPPAAVGSPTASFFHIRLEIRYDNSLALLKIESILKKIIFYEYWKSNYSIVGVFNLRHTAVGGERGL